MPISDKQKEPDMILLLPHSESSSTWKSCRFWPLWGIFGELFGSIFERREEIMLFPSLAVQSQLDRAAISGKLEWNEQRLRLLPRSPIPPGDEELIPDINVRVLSGTLPRIRRTISPRRHLSLHSLSFCYMIAVRVLSGTLPRDRHIIAPRWNRSLHPWLFCCMITVGCVRPPMQLLDRSCCCLCMKECLCTREPSR